jgi:hypothetical protein
VLSLGRVIDGPTAGDIAALFGSLAETSAGAQGGSGKGHKRAALVKKMDGYPVGFRTGGN